MDNLEIKHKIQIRAHFTPEEWHVGHLEDNYALTIQLNIWLEYYVNSGFSRPDIENNMGVILKSYGSHNSEPLQFLDVVLNKVFMK